MGQSTIDDILYYSYDPRKAKLPDNVAECAQPDQVNESTDRLLEMGARAWQEAIDSCIQDHPENEPCIVPLSSGWDSRFVLGGLLAHNEVQTSSIIAYTFGVPGTRDYELGQQIALSAGVKHVPINLNEIEWSVDQLSAYVRTRTNVSRFFEGYCQQHAIEQVNTTSGGIVYSGAMAGPISGSHDPTAPAESWEEALHWFAEENRATSLASEDHDPYASLPNEPLLDRTTLAYELQLDLAVRQHRFNRPIVEANGFEYRFPGLRPEWLSVMLNIPRELRKGQEYYTSLLEKLYPRLYALPSGNTGAISPARRKTEQVAARAIARGKYEVLTRLNQQPTHPATNYLNWDSELRKGESLTETIGRLLADARNRRELSHLDIDELWRDHQRGANNAHELRILANIQLGAEAAMI